MQYESEYLISQNIRSEHSYSSYSTQNQFHFQHPQKSILTFNGAASTGEVYLKNPTGLCIDRINGFIFIAENSSILAIHTKPTINVFTSQGDYMTTFGRDFIDPPCQISVTIDEYSFYVLDQLEQRIIQFTDFAINTISIDLPLPRGIVCDEDGFVYVIDGYSRRICVFSRELKLLNKFGLSIAAFPLNLDILSDILVILCNPISILYCSLLGDKLRNIDLWNIIIPPKYFCIDTETNNTFVSDLSNNCIKVYNMDGELIRTIGSSNRINRKLTPSFIAVTNFHTLLVINSGDDGINAQMFPL
ncbi:hypothetical protein LOD99_2352 [Oopsacas minuta]|uniref:NHL repeat containing protein n=1 Tax=Oopsacas minuta TaxID=111878 RepID=A0AAV7K1G6_9METZ|nr:hypothetical protein LOD99_2352 [Oopsacas minuta]